MFKMRNTLIVGGSLAALAVAVASTLSVGATRSADGPQVAHSVFFKLKDNSAQPTGPSWPRRANCF